MHACMYVYYNNYGLISKIYAFCFAQIWSFMPFVEYEVGREALRIQAAVQENKLQEFTVYFDSPASMPCGISLHCSDTFSKFCTTVGSQCKLLIVILHAHSIF